MVQINHEGMSLKRMLAHEYHHTVRIQLVDLLSKQVNSIEWNKQQTDLPSLYFS